MKKPYKQHRLLKIKNINNSYKNRYKIRFSLLGLNYTIKNKTKIEFYRNKANYEKINEYEKNKEILDNLKKYREGKEYIITCILITYNHKDTIERAIESILSQQTKYPFLIKITDDCSTDGTTEICMEYAKKYPDKIQLSIQKENTKGRHAASVFRTIKTKYYAALDGDDYWCDNSKIEKGLDFLENNPNYVAWAHDCLLKKIKLGINCSYTHEDQGIKDVINPISYDNYFYIAFGARICRNVIDFTKEYEYNHKRDIFLWYILLDKGNVYFHDEIMSVYEFTGKGVFSSLHNLERYYSRIYGLYKINQYLNYRHDDYFTEAVKSKRLVICKKLFGCKLGWFIYIKFKKRKFLNKLFKERIKRFENIEYGHNLFTEEEYQGLLELAKGQE